VDVSIEDMRILTIITFRYYPYLGAMYQVFEQLAGRGSEVTRALCMPLAGEKRKRVERLMMMQ
jgi:hypothetical protein